jgi:hypothetical protein
MPGTHAQNVSLVALEPQEAPPASTEADGLALALALPLAVVPVAEGDEPLLPQAASSVTAAAPATPVMVSRANLFFGNISGELLCFGDVASRGIAV